ncbi:MAG: hypothetical protein GY862_01760 [Gammaproteobacteria bacterium]|nr:hypothetical protein [Gammaproteobacteria bacterium]
MPINALLRINDNKALLFLIGPDSQAVRGRKVEFRFIKGAKALILSDLSEFTQAVVSGQHNLKDGDQVELVRQERK